MRTRLALRALIAPLVLLCAACAEEDGTAPGDDVYGVWRGTVDTDVFYQDIRPDSITSYAEAGDCYIVRVFEVVDREGDVFTLDDDGTERIVIITRTGDRGLVIEVAGQESQYEWADIDPDDLDTC